MLLRPLLTYVPLDTPGLTTFHARSVNDAINRLQTALFRKQPGLSNEALSAEIATAVQLVITTGPCRRSGRLRIKDLTEIGTNPDGSLFQNQLFKYVLEGEVPRWRQINNRSMYALADE